jgi:hypothetical protein
MIRNLLPLTALLMGSAFLLFAGGVNSLILPVRGEAEGFSAISLGLLGTGWACLCRRVLAHASTRRASGSYTRFWCDVCASGNSSADVANYLRSVDLDSCGVPCLVSALPGPR